jgi:hypothetical protein
MSYFQMEPPPEPPSAGMSQKIHQQYKDEREEAIEEFEKHLAFIEIKTGRIAACFIALAFFIHAMLSSQTRLLWNLIVRDWRAPLVWLSVVADTWVFNTYYTRKLYLVLTGKLKRNTDIYWS